MHRTRFLEKGDHLYPFGDLCSRTGVQEVREEKSRMADFSHTRNSFSKVLEFWYLS